MIYLIGASGFIGTVLSKELKQENVTFKNLDKQSSATYPDTTVITDIRNKEQITANIGQGNGDDWVVLLAAEHRDDVSPTSLYYDVNVTGTQNVLDVMEAKGLNKIIFTSSVAIYGLDKNDPSEDHPADPFNHYGKSKWAAEEVLRAWYEKDPANRSLVIIRPTVVFGPGNRGNVYNLLKQIATGKFVMIGKGENKKSMAYVDNITGLIRYAIKNVSGYNVFNYADKPDLSMNELVKVAEESLNKKLPGIRIPYPVGYMAGISFDILSTITRKKFPISAVRVKKFCATTQFSNTTIIKHGYKPAVSLKEGLARTLSAIVADDRR
ncbi:Nucleoside-diphosphate-sugar epimerase [Chitinophaga sp. YR627]|uniref:NAD-dependent epimerase/dehydratase family protein n=1 Tax=Chitinophaga sp. YR627 TaxID=1881041 RepID=UPI0008E828C1|nr:NAD-dependent epimerase/dehydratase family protein [Chitinophaga sp. YR627]SFN92113.1 Nucleoside-diphosphate-sugar epimerase [Chitinophaga sp. YR627]